MNFLQKISNALRGGTTATPPAMPHSTPGRIQTENRIADLATPPEQYAEHISTPNPTEADGSDDAALLAFAETRKMETLRREREVSAQREYVRRHNREQMDREKRDRDAAREAARAEREAREQQEALARQTPLTWPQKYGPMIKHDSPPMLTRRLVELIVEKKNLHAKIAEAGRKLEPIRERFYSLVEQRRAIGANAALRMFRETLGQAHSKVAQGEPVKMPLAFADPQQTENQNAINRVLLREQMRGQGELAAPIVSKIAALLQETAREIVIELEETEIAEARGYELPFEPSALLRALIHGGFTLEQTTIRDSVLLPGLDKNAFLWGLLEK